MAQNNQLDLTESITTRVQTDVPLTDFELQESKLEEKTGFDLPKYLDINPWVNQTPVGVLEREYRLDVGTIVVPSTTDNLTYFNVYTEFSNANTQFAQMFRSFRYFRFKKLHFRVVLTTSPFIYGFLCFTMLPDLDSRDAPGDDYGWFSHDDAVLVDVCSMNEVKLSMDWAFTDNWMDIKANHETNFNYLMSLKMVYLADSLKQLSVTGPTGIDYQVFYRFEGVEVAGFSSSSIVVQSQSYFGMAAGAIGGMFADTAVKYASKKVSEGVMSGMDYAEAQAKKALEQGFGVDMDGEGEEVGAPTKSVSGSQTGEGNASFLPDLFGGLVYSPPKNVLGDGTSVPNFVKKKHSLLEFLMKPSLINHFHFNSAGSNFTMTCNPFEELLVLRPDSAYVISCSRLRFLGKFFRQWRGSISYTFVIFGSPLVAYRMLLTLKYGGLETAEMGDFYNKTFTVRGTNIVNITVPFLYPVNWLHTNHAVGQPFPEMRLDYEAVVGMSTSTPGPIVMLYEAAEPDFQFSSRREVAPTYFVESQMLVSGLCQTTKQGNSRVNVSREVDGVKTFEDMAQRWSVRATPSLEAQPLYNPSVAANSYLSIGSFDALASVFLYYRGQMKFKITPNKSPTNASVTWTIVLYPALPASDVNLTGMPPAIAFANGATLININTTQVAEFTVPFVANRDWSAFGTQNYNVSEITDYVFNPLVYVSNESQEPTFNPGIGICAVSGGTDFAYSFQMPPPAAKARWYDLPALPPLRDMRKRHPKVETTTTRA